MTPLRRATNGDWFARRMAPEDVRAGHRATFGASQEARFRAPASTRANTSKQAFRDWDAEVTSRIERLRAEARGEGLPTLTRRQAHAVAGDWYEEEPGAPEQWDFVAEQYETSFSKSRYRDLLGAKSTLDVSEPSAKARAAALISDCACALATLARADASPVCAVTASVSVLTPAL
jgi:hypothetical protein